MSTASTSAKLTPMERWGEALDPTSRRVLITDGGGVEVRSTLAAVRALAMGGYTPVVTSSEKRSLAAASRYTVGVVEVPPAPSAEYSTEVWAELASGDYLTVLPASDVAMEALGAPGRSLTNKVELQRLAEAAGVSAPASVVYADIDELRQGAVGWDYPVVVKAAASWFETRCLTEPEQVDGVEPEAAPYLVQPFLDDPMHAVGGVVHRGVLRAAVHQSYLRIWPRDCGTASAAVSIAPALELEASLLPLLTRHDGVFQAQFKGGMLLDLNPRVYGSLPLAVAAGANLPALYCDLLAGKERPLVRGRTDVRYRWIEGDLRHLLEAWRDGSSTLTKALVAALPRRTTAHSVLTWRDPLPALGRLRRAIGSRRRSGRSRA